MPYVLGIFMGKVKNHFVPLAKLWAQALSVWALRATGIVGTDPFALFEYFGEYDEYHMTCPIFLKTFMGTGKRAFAPDVK